MYFNSLKEAKETGTVGDTIDHEGKIIRIVDDTNGGGCRSCCFVLEDCSMMIKPACIGVKRFDHTPIHFEVVRKRSKKKGSKMKGLMVGKQNRKRGRKQAFQEGDHIMVAGNSRSAYKGQLGTVIKVSGWHDHPSKRYHVRMGNGVVRKYQAWQLQISYLG